MPTIDHAKVRREITTEMDLKVVSFTMACIKHRSVENEK